MRFKKISAMIVTLTLTLTAHAAVNHSNQKSQLKNLNQNIASIKTELHQATIKKSQLQTALEKTEITESTINQQLKTTQRTLQKQQDKLTQLKKQSMPLANAKNQNRALLKQQIQTAYLFNQQSYLKLLLTPDDVTKTHRILMYFHYLMNAQLKTMQQLQQSLFACKHNQQAIQKQYSKLLALKQTQLQNQQALQKAQTQRQQLIETISQRIETKHQKLLMLLHDKQHLEKTLQTLTTQTTPLLFNTQTTVPHLPFGQLRGKLSWPTAGTVRHQFGTQIDQSELKWDGTLIAAPLGQAIHAVAAGRVIFSKWMAGYGLLLIINQGNGYMTLYGRAQTLTKAVGDNVKANEVIGTVGKSGGFTRSALYFSIRRHGDAVNPAIWCH